MTLQEAFSSVLPLQSQWSARNTPQMKQRGNLINNVLPDLLKPIATRHGMRVEGSDGAGSRSRVPWVRIFDPSLSPSATKGWYVVFLPEASGKWVYLSLNQGTIKWAKGDKKPISRELTSSRAAKARKLLAGAVTSSFLQSIQLNDPGFGRNYEPANVYAVKYDAGSIPLDAQISNDLEKFIELLKQLYSAEGGAAKPDTLAKATYLLAWNPEQWQWEDLAATVSKLESGQSLSVNDTWTIANHNVKAGDRLFLIRLGKEPRGIVGSGYSLSGPQRRKHHSGDSSKTSHYVDVQWEALLNPETENILSLSTLQQEIPEMHWSTQKSGILIPAEDCFKLEELWQAVVKSRLAPDPYGLEEALSELFIEKSVFQDMIELLGRRKNLVIQGPPGTGKTFIAKRLAFTLMGQRDTKRLEWVQFHQSYSYEDFIQGFRPNGNSFSLRSGIFLRFCQRAAEDRNRAYVFVIDEINRGNLSRIFGEVLSLLEEDKREVLSVRLAYGSPDPDARDWEPFTIPKNVYVVGLMNTADRSLAVVDYALRRRFAFISLSPRFQDPKFQNILSEKGISAAMIAKIVGNLSNLNDRIRADKRNLGTGFEIGHSYFCPKETVSNENEWYRKIIEYEVRPLLQEYWFDDPDKALNVAEDLMSEDSN